MPILKLAHHEHVSKNNNVYCIVLNILAIRDDYSDVDL